MARFSAQESQDTRRDLLRTERGFRHACEAELAKHSDYLCRFNSGRLSHEGGSEGNQDWASAVEEIFDARKIIANLFRIAGTGENTIATKNAVFRDDTRISILYANSFDVTLANALVTILALPAFGIDGMKRRHSSALRNEAAGESRAALRHLRRDDVRRRR